jgi:hypothetical protein
VLTLFVLVTLLAFIIGISVPDPDAEIAFRVNVLLSPEFVIDQVIPEMLPLEVISEVVKVAVLIEELKVTVNEIGKEVVGSACPEACSTVTLKLEAVSPEAVAVPGLKITFEHDSTIVTAITKIKLNKCALFLVS